MASIIVTDPRRLARIVSYFRFDYVVMDVLPGSALEASANDWLATPGKKEGLRVVDLRAREFPSLDDLSRAIELELDSSAI
jgi:hypothetical protein